MELTPKTALPRLRPCRKCGGAPRLTRWTALYFHCPQCGEEGPDGRDEAQAAQAWNHEQGS